MLETAVATGYPNRSPIGPPVGDPGTESRNGIPRTYGRTYGDVLTLGANSCVSYRAQGVARFSSDSFENGGADASALRGSPDTLARAARGSAAVRAVLAAKGNPDA